MIFQKGVVVQYDKIDRYGRVVGKILLEGRDINLEQIRRGMAWHYKQYEMEQSDEDRVAYAIAEVRARGARTGLWMHRDPIPPWLWRRM